MPPRGNTGVRCALGGVGEAVVETKAPARTLATRTWMCASERPQPGNAGIGDRAPTT